jgi:hypothetical protein
MQRRIAAPSETPPSLLCNSLAPKVCFDIYRRRMERTPEPILYGESSAGGDIRVGPSAAPEICDLRAGRVTIAVPRECARLWIVSRGKEPPTSQGCSSHVAPGKNARPKP